MTTSPHDDANPVLSLTAHELLYLFDLEDSQPSRANRARLGLAGVADSPELISAGAATLLVRGLAFVDEGEVKLTKETGLIGYVLTHATEWTEVGASAADVQDGTAMFTADELTLILMPQALGVYGALFVGPGVTRESFVKGLVTTFLDGGDDRMVVVRAGDGASTRSGAVVRTGGTRWRSADLVPSGDDAELAEDTLRESDRRSAIDQVAAVAR